MKKEAINLKVGGYMGGYGGRELYNYNLKKLIFLK